MSKVLADIKSQHEQGEELSDSAIDYLIKQAEKFEKVEFEVNNSDMGEAVGNIIEIVNS